jgi:hypothetical protein
MKHLQGSILTLVIFKNNRVYPNLHVIPKKGGFEVISTMNISYGWFVDVKSIYKYMNQG